MVRTNKPSDMAVNHQISHAHENRKVYIHRISPVVYDFRERISGDLEAGIDFFEGRKGDTK